MFCPKCGAQLDCHAKFCGMCGYAVGTSVYASDASQSALKTNRNASEGIQNTDGAYKKNKSKKAPKGKGSHKRILIIAAFIAAMAAVIVVGAQVWKYIEGRVSKPDDFVQQDLEAVSENVYLDAGFCDDKITDEQSALEAIRQTSEQTGIENAEEELELIRQNTAEDFDIYRFRQIYQGIEVFGNQMIVASDENDDAFCLHSNYCSVKDTDLDAELSEEDCAEKAEAAAKRLGITANAACTFMGDCIYLRNGSGVYCYKYCVSGYSEDGLCAYTVLLDADNGETLYSASEIHYESTECEVLGEDEDGDGTRELINIVCNMDAQRKCTMENVENRMYIYDAVHQETKIKRKKKNVWMGTRDQDGMLVTWTQETGKTDYGSLVGNAAEANANISMVYDYYHDHFFLYGYGHAADDTDMKVYLNVSAIMRNADKKNLIEYSDNAFYWAGDGNHYGECMAFCPVSEGEELYCKYLDIVAHEYTHGVMYNTIGITEHHAQMDALDEAYADIMSQVIEWTSTGEADWELSMKTRNLKEPKLSKENVQHITKFEEYYDGLDCHGASTLISHTAYQMNRGYDDATHTGTAIDMESLGKLWFYSMYLLTDNATFQDCAWAVLNTGKLLCKRGILSDCQLYTITRAFSENGILPVDDSVYENMYLTGLEKQNAEAYAAYKKVVEEQEQLHGSFAVSNTNDVYSDRYLAGVSYLDLRDFDQDGTDEMLLYYTDSVSESGMPVYAFVIYQYSKESKTAEPVFEGTGTSETNGGCDFIYMYTENGKPYLSTCGWSRETLENGNTSECEFVRDYGEKDGDIGMTYEFLTFNPYTEKEIYYENGVQVVTGPFRYDDESRVYETYLLHPIPMDGDETDWEQEILDQKADTLAKINDTRKKLGLTEVSYDTVIQSDETDWTGSADNEDKADNARAAYQRLLQDVHDEPQNYMELLEISGTVNKSDIEECDFAIYDVNLDGVEDIVITFTNTYGASQYAGIWTWDEESGQVKSLGQYGEALEYYRTGILKINASHNHSMGDTIWPYMLYRYDENQQEFLNFAGGYCVDRDWAEQSGSQEYQVGLDADGDGVLYYFSLDGVDYGPLTEEEYLSYTRQYIPEEDAVVFQWNAITNENIATVN